MEQQPKAKKVFLQLAKVFEERNDVVDRMDALQRAAACDPDDAALASEVGAAVAMAERVKLRLSAQEWSAPSSEEEAQVVVRARVLADYGFPDRAKAVLEESNGVRESVSVRAMMAEVLAQLDDVSGAIAEMEAIAGGDESARMSLRESSSSAATSTVSARGLSPRRSRCPSRWMTRRKRKRSPSTWRRKRTMRRRRIPPVRGGVDHESEGDRLAAEGDAEAPFQPIRRRSNPIRPTRRC